MCRIELLELGACSNCCIEVLFMIREMTSSDTESVAIIHHNSLSDAFLSRFGVRFLKTMYDGLLLSENGFGFVSIDEQNGEVNGFVTGSRDTSQMFGDIFKRKWFFLGIHSLKRILVHPGDIANIFQTFRYPEITMDEVNAELISLAVKNRCRGRGIGIGLVKKVIERFSFLKENVFKVTVDEANIGANAFYVRNGFNLSGRFDIYGKGMNIYNQNLNSIT